MSIFRRTRVCFQCGVVYRRRKWDKVAPHLCEPHAEPVKEAKFKEDRILAYLRVNKKRMAALLKEEERFVAALEEKKDGEAAYRNYLFASHRMRIWE